MTHKHFVTLWLRLIQISTRHCIVGLIFSGCTTSISRAKDMVGCHGWVNVKRNAESWQGFALNLLLVMGVSFDIFTFYSLKCVSGFSFWMLCWGSGIHTTLWWVPGHVSRNYHGEMFKWCWNVPWCVMSWSSITSINLHSSVEVPVIVFYFILQNWCIWWAHIKEFLCRCS